MATLGHGKVCHLAIPARDVEQSAAFYEDHLGWRINRQPQATTFDDGVGEVSGHFVPHATPMSEPGILVYVMVDDIDAAVDRLRASGIEIVADQGVDPGELTAWFRDPGGNVLGLYEEPRA